MFFNGLNFCHVLKEKAQKNLAFKHFNVTKNLNHFSDGTILIIALITKILSSENDIFLIEEPENSTHPKALVDLLLFLKSFSENKQFIITSHSIAILNKTKTDNIIVSSINDEGKSVFYNITNKTDLKRTSPTDLYNYLKQLATYRRITKEVSQIEGDLFYKIREPLHQIEANFHPQVFNVPPVGDKQKRVEKLQSLQKQYPLCASCQHEADDQIQRIQQSIDDERRTALFALKNQIAARPFY